MVRVMQEELAAVEQHAEARAVAGLIVAPR